MSAADHTLTGLGRELLACADRALLDAPLDALDELVTDEAARELLQGICESGAADCLRDLLATDRLVGWLAENATEREESALRGQFVRWLGAGQGAGDDPGRLTQIPALPNDIEGVLAWARPHDLLGELTRPAAEVLADGQAMLGSGSLLEWSLGLGDQMTRGTSLLARDRPREQARAYLVRQARAHAALSARAALWKRMPAQGPLRGLSERLSAVVAGTDFRALHAVDFVAARPVTLDAARGTAQGQLRTVDAPASVRVRLFLSGHEQRALRGDCPACAGAACLHVRALAARLLDACLEPADRLHAQLLDVARVPSWKRFVLAVQGDAASPHAKPAGERLGFRIRLDGERLRVAVVVQRRLTDGRWSPGTLASPRTMLRSPLCSDLDRPVLELMAFANRTPRPQFLPADLGVLRSLHEHPFVQWEGGQDALQVVEESIRLELIEQPDGLLPRVTLGDAPLASGARSRDFDMLVHADPTRARLVFAPLTPSLRRLLAALEHFSGVLPQESYPSLAPWLASIQQIARVTLPKSLQGTERAAPSKLLFRITPGRDEGIDVALSAGPLPLGALWPPGQGPTLIHGLEHGLQVYARRDLDRERACAAQLIDALQLHTFARIDAFAYRIEAPQAALALLSNAARLCDRLDIEWAERSPRLGVTGTVRAGDLQIRLFKKGHWLRIEGGANLAGGAEIAVGRLLEAARRNERFVPVAGQGYVEIERELFERLARAQLCVNESLREPAIASAAGAFWLATLDTETAAGDAPTRAFIERARGRDSADAAEPRPGDARLRDYQRDGVAWLVERSGWAPGVCLADEMGLGKTVQAIGLLQARAALGPGLVVAPTSVVQNWCDELAVFAPELTVTLHRGPDRELRAAELGPGSILITSYELLLRDIARFTGIVFATQVIDEAQVVKNARTQRAKAVRSVAALFRVALSGTPVENRLGDLWSLFQLLTPGLLGSWARFRARFGVPIERYEDQARAQALRALVSPFLLRRTKDQVARELPLRTELVHRVELSPAEQDLYDTALQHARRAIGKRRHDDAARGVQILAEITRLRQLACHPRLVLDDSRVESSKLRALLHLLEDILPRGHRVLLFSQFTRHLALMRDALAELDISQLYLDGSTPGPQRASLVERFQRGEAQVFLISLKAGGTGLNLTAADYVVHMDPWWNPAAEDQASDRAHRLGQDRPLTIVKLVASGTIEEQVLGLHEHKRKLAASVLCDSSVSAPLDASALEALLGGA